MKHISVKLDIYETAAINTVKIPQLKSDQSYKVSQPARGSSDGKVKTESFVDGANIRLR